MKKLMAYFTRETIIMIELAFLAAVALLAFISGNWGTLIVALGLALQRILYWMVLYHPTASDVSHVVTAYAYPRNLIVTFTTPSGELVARFDGSEKEPKTTDDTNNA